VPARLIGRFGVMGPGPNAKGRLEAGILFQHGWFLEGMPNDSGQLGSDAL
jgi:hypothetical protein